MKLSYGCDFRFYSREVDNWTFLCNPFEIFVFFVPVFLNVNVVEFRTVVVFGRQVAAEFIFLFCAGYSNRVWVERGEISRRKV